MRALQLRHMESERKEAAMVCDGGQCGCAGCEDAAGMAAELGGERIECGECGHMVAEKEVVR